MTGSAAAPDAEGRARPRRRPGDAGALLLCVLAGALLSGWPHWRAWATRGDPAFLADYDELEVYLPVAARSYREHPGLLRDPVALGAAPTMYPWLQLGPGILLARAAGWGPLGISLAWRLLAGLATGACVYLALRQVLGRPAVAAVAGLYLLSDLGLVFGSPLLHHARATLGLLRGDPSWLNGWPKLHANWRLITPALSWPWLLGALALWSRCAARPTRRRCALAGAGLGLLVGVYFYHWTAAALGLVLWALAVPGRRRAALGLAAAAAAVGAAPFLTNAWVRATATPDWLQRSDLFVPVPRGEGFAPPLLAWAWLALLTALSWRREPRLRPALAVAAAALLLHDHQVLSGLQLQNWHWTYAAGPPLCFAAAAWAGSRWEARWPEGAPRALGAAACALGLAFAGSGLLLRHRGCEAALPRRLEAALVDYRAHHAGAARGLVAGERDYVGLAFVLDGARPLAGDALRFSAALTREAWEERIALEAALRGLEPGEFREEQRRELEQGFYRGYVRSQPGGVEGVLLRRLAHFQRARQSLAETARRVGVGELALPAEASPRRLPAGWTLLRRGPRWQVWGPPAGG